MRRPTARDHIDQGHRGIGWMLIGLVPVSGAARATPAAGSDDVKASVGAITVSATSLRPGRSGMLTSQLQMTTDAAESDQLDAVLVNVGEISDLASCDGDTPPPSVVDHWLHYGPLLVPGLANGPAPPATATLTIPTVGPVSFGGNVTVTLYFAHAGQLDLRLPVDQT
jgi:hypothetical protein